MNKMQTYFMVIFRLRCKPLYGHFQETLFNQFVVYYYWMALSKFWILLVFIIRMIRGSRADKPFHGWNKPGRLLSPLKLDESLLWADLSKIQISSNCILFPNWNQFHSVKGYLSYIICFNVSKFVLTNSQMKVFHSIFLQAWPSIFIWRFRSSLVISTRPF